MKIPSTIEEAIVDLNGIESLLTAKGWERAAIVAAFVRLNDGPGNPGMRTSTHSAHSFAALGINGLKSDRTVRTYVQHWLDAHDGIYPEPGAEVELPDLPWPPTGKDGINWGQLADKPGFTIAEKLTAEQRVTVAAAILSHSTPLEREQIEDRADVHVISQDVVRNVRRAVSEHEAGTAPFYVNDTRWLVKTMTDLRISLTERPDIVQDFFAQVDLMKAEFAVDGKITVENEDFRAWAEASDD